MFRVKDIEHSTVRRHKNDRDARKSSHERQKSACVGPNYDRKKRKSSRVGRKRSYETEMHPCETGFCACETGICSLYWKLLWVLRLGQAVFSSHVQTTPTQNRDRLQGHPPQFRRRGTARGTHSRACHARSPRYAGLLI